MIRVFYIRYAYASNYADFSEEDEEFDGEDSEREFDDGEVSLNVPPRDRSSGRGLSALPRRRRSAEARGGDEFFAESGIVPCSARRVAYRHR
jgi:hypothetical protein